MGDLLKEAIADAKAVRETALANAKMALEEAFTPQLKSMLSAKLKEDEFEDEEEIGGEEEFGGEEEIPAEEMEDEEGGEEEVPAEEGDYSEEEEFGGEEEVPAEEIPGEEEGDEDVAETIQLNGHTYRLAEEEDEEGEEIAEEEEGEEDNLDLEAVIKELESEINEEEDEDGDEVNESEDGMEGETDQVEGDEKPEHVGGDLDEEYEIDTTMLEQEDENDVGDEDGTVEEQSDSSQIGTGDNKVDVADSDDEEDPQGGGVVKAEFSEGKLHAELKEYKEAVKFLKDKLHEVNILNAKLLFTNKLFKEFVLDNSSKMKVVENFDRAQTVREIKLVYATLCESFRDSSSVKRKKSINESASSKSGSTKPKRKIISEVDSVADRFKKLAGLKQS